MSEWSQLTIGDLCDAGLAHLQTGPFGSQLHAHDYVEHGIAVVPTEAIRNRHIDHSSLPQIAPEKARELSRHELRRDDILFARRGVQATGHTALVRESEAGFICGTGAILLRTSEGNIKVHADFLSHVLSASKSVAWFKFHAIGATMPNLNEGIIRSFPLTLPPFDEQRLIADLLSALDGKAALNDAINETLQGLLHASFRDWFRKFGPTCAKLNGAASYLPNEVWQLFPGILSEEKTPKGWKAGRLGDIADCPRRGVSPSDVSPETPYIGLEHMPRRSIALTAWENAGKVTSNKSEFAKGEFLFGKLRPYFHKVGIAPISGICSTDIVVVTPKSETWSAYTLACISSDEFVAYTDRTSTGTKMPRTKWETMAQYPLTLPPDEIARAYDDFVRPAIDGIMANIHQSLELAQMRELLLPRLISGEIRLREAEKAVEAVA